MKAKHIVVLAATLAASHVALADHDKVVYSTEGYCVLKKENVDTRYLEAYADKLGFTPRKKPAKALTILSQPLSPKTGITPRAVLIPAAYCASLKHKSSGSKKPKANLSPLDLPFCDLAPNSGPFYEGHVSWASQNCDQTRKAKAGDLAAPAATSL